MRLKDKVAIVTGAGGGIGMGIAERFGKEGASVVIAEIDPARGKAVAERIVQNGGKARVVRTDVSKAEDVDQLVDFCRNEFDRIDILVNNAARVTFGPSFLDLELTTWQKTLDVNLTGMFLCSQAVARLMVQQQIQGRIINLASINSFGAERFGTAYVTTKAGVLGLTRTMAVELAQYGILVNAIAPGPILTETSQAPFAQEPYQTGIKKGVLLGRPGTPEEIACVAVFLASDESSFVDGTVFCADGGFLAQLRFN